MKSFKVKVLIASTLLLYGAEAFAKSLTVVSTAMPATSHSAHIGL
jgi:hypothetical protein